MAKAFKVCLYLLSLCGIIELILLAYGLFISNHIEDLVWMIYPLYAGGVIVVVMIPLAIVLSERKVFKK